MKILSNKKQINIRVYEEIKIRADVTENMFRVLILIIFLQTKLNANSCSFVDCFLCSSPFMRTVHYLDNKHDTVLEIYFKKAFSSFEYQTRIFKLFFFPSCHCLSTHAPWRNKDLHHLFFTVSRLLYIFQSAYF